MTDADLLAYPATPDLAEPDPDVDSTPWEIDGDRTATWALRKLSVEQREVERIEAVYHDERARLDAWLDAALTRPLHRKEFFESKLIGYRLRLEDAAADRGEELPRTYRLPGGSLVVRAGRARRVVADEATVVEWATRNAPEAVRRSVLVSKLPGEQVDGRLVTDDGEPVPGVTIETSDPSYSVTLDGAQ